MPINRDDLASAMEQLEHALAARAAGRENAWRAAVDAALAGLEQTVRQHAKTLLPDDGKLIDVDRPRIPSPGVSRRAGELQEDLFGFLNEVRALRARLNATIPPDGPPDNPRDAAGALAVAPEAGALADFGVFRQRAKDLLANLQAYEDQEAKLILESVNTDIGAGD